MKILVTDGMDKTALEQLKQNGHEVTEQFYPPEELGAALKEYDAVVVRSATKIRANHIDEAKTGKLKLIIRGGVGVDNIDVKYAEAAGITVKNTPRASSNSVAELAMGHMFSCARFLSVAGATMRAGKWEKKAYGKGIELQGKTLARLWASLPRPSGCMSLPLTSTTSLASRSRWASPMWRWMSCWLRPTSSASTPLRWTAAR